MLIFDPSTVWLEIPQAIQTESWQQSQPIAIPGNRWQAYLNQVCLHTVLPWLQEKTGEIAKVDPIYNSQFWELVNGSAVVVGDIRFILIPIEAMDQSEFRVPQEWIDIPSWVGDYYLAVEVDADEQEIHVWGYTTHHQLKLQGSYDASDRTYSLDGNDLIQDLSVLGVMLHLETEATRSEIAPLATLAPEQAEVYIKQFSHPAIALPRLVLPFTEWGALLEQTHWRQQLFEQRQINLPLTQTFAPAQIKLGEWLQNVFESGWQSLEELLTVEPNLAFSFRQADSLEDWLRRVKRIQLGKGLPTVLLLVMLKTEPDQRRNIWVQLVPWIGEPYLPSNLQLTLLSIEGETLQSVQASDQSNYIQLRRFKCPLGRQFRLQVAIADITFSEEFVA
ncbi:DUF1822 family protein [Pantanalinema sp. GBBB05]|uniref:DUF1822 family protein n=1 Tax=Pantanalinema sp. GBBB05 TaxID=2604139 RepID=UPI001D6A5BAA|nr:DUF1822 family protein [Pantanalinema sp. GBBB05]